MSLRDAAQQALEVIGWLRLHLQRDHQCLHMDSTGSGIPAWIAKSQTAICAALAEPQPEIEQLKAERDALLAALKEAVECDGGDDGLFHACCGESFWTAHDVKCWVPKAKAAIDAVRGKT